MATLTHATKPLKASQINRKKILIDVEGHVLGRVATKVAEILQGKHKVSYVPYLDVGDEVYIVNADKIMFTGRKLDQKEYQTYSGYPGGQKSYTLRTMMHRRPTEVLRRAISGMLPKNKLRDKRLKRLHLYTGAEIPQKDAIDMTVTIHHN